MAEVMTRKLCRRVARWSALIVLVMPLAVSAQVRRLQLVCSAQMEWCELLRSEYQKASAQGVKDIANSVREQSSSSTSMAINVDQIARMADKNARSATEALSSVSVLETMANTLDTIVQRFRTSSSEH